MRYYSKLLTCIVLVNIRLNPITHLPINLVFELFSFVTFSGESGCIRFRWNNNNFSWLTYVREAIRTKNLLLFIFFPNDLDPPPPCLFGLKFLNVFGFWLSSHIFLGKCLSQRRQKVPRHLWNQVRPPHSWKMSKLKQKSFSTFLESGKFPNREVPQKVWKYVLTWTEQKSS